MIARSLLFILIFSSLLHATIWSQWQGNQQHNGLSTTCGDINTLDLKWDKTIGNSTALDKSKEVFSLPLTPGSFEIYNYSGSKTYENSLADDQYYAIIADSLYGMSSYWERTQYGIRNFKYHFTVFNSSNAQMFQLETTGNYLTNSGTRMSGALRGNGVWILGIILWYEGLYNVGVIRAYDDTGNTTWSLEIRSVPNQRSISMDKNGVVYASCDPGYDYGEDVPAAVWAVSNGAEVWHYNFSSGSGYNGFPVVDDKSSPAQVYVIRDSTLNALKATDGSVIFTYERATYPPAVASSGNIYLPSDTKLLCLSKTGSLISSYTASSRILGSPVITKNGSVYITCNGKLILLNSSMSAKWQSTQSGITEHVNLMLGESDYVFVHNPRTGRMLCFGDVSGFKNSISELPKQGLFTASPNPFIDRLSLLLPYSACIYSLTGELMRRLDKGQCEINTSRWHGGVYLIKCGNEVKRIIKIR